MDEYNFSDSEDDYSKEDKVLLENARDSMRAKDISSDEEVFGFVESDSIDDEREDNDVDMESDMEDEEQLPDERAWGNRKRNFYSTDFIDQDYEGIYQGDEAEKAELEEQEARNIQKRLLEQLNETDFSISEAVDIANATDEVVKQEIIQSDLTKLTKRQKLDMIYKESPEFFMLVEDFKNKMQDVQYFYSVIQYFTNKVNESFPALDFLKLKLNLILNYCTNISFYVFLKTKRIPVKNHPVMKSLYKYRQLLQQIEVNDKIVKPQIDEVLEFIKKGKDVPLDETVVKRKTTLKVLSKKQKKYNTNEEIKTEEINEVQNLEEVSPVMDKEAVNKKDEKRAITYEMAKNKGLIPKRSKEQRNPRVKHRRKYEKAKIRRRGQVRTPRNEIPLYGGEPTGIKIRLTKSIKLKY